MIEYYTGISPDYFIIGLGAAFLILLLLLIILMVKFSGLKKKYKIFMEGNDAGSLEDTLILRLDQVDELIASNNKNERNIEDINRRLHFAIDKYGIVRYDALEELGGKLSYAIALLDEGDNGFIINYMHGRDGSYSYLKEVINQNTVSNLSEEEKAALSKAISGKDR